MPSVIICLEFQPISRRTLYSKFSNASTQNTLTIYFDTLYRSAWTDLKSRLCRYFHCVFFLQNRDGHTPYHLARKTLAIYNFSSFLCYCIYKHFFKLRIKTATQRNFRTFFTLLWSILYMYMGFEG